MAAIELVRERVEVSIIRQRLMKRRVEDGDLWETCAEDLARRRDASDVGRIMERRKLDAIFDAVIAFRGTGPQVDDMTAVAVKITA